MSTRVALVMGASSGIGRAVARETNELQPEDPPDGRPAQIFDPPA